MKRSNVLKLIAFSIFVFIMQFFIFNGKVYAAWQVKSPYNDAEVYYTNIHLYVDGEEIEPDDSNVYKKFISLYPSSNVVTGGTLPDSKLDQEPGDYGTDWKTGKYQIITNKAGDRGVIEWYDNPEFNGEPISTFLFEDYPDGSSFYAKTGPLVTTYINGEERKLVVGRTYSPRRIYDDYNITRSHLINDTVPENAIERDFNDPEHDIMASSSYSKNDSDYNYYVDLTYPLKNGINGKTPVKIIHDNTYFLPFLNINDCKKGSDDITTCGIADPTTGETITNGIEPFGIKIISTNIIQELSSYYQMLGFIDQYGNNYDDIFTVNESFDGKYLTAIIDSKQTCTASPSVLPAAELGIGDLYNSSILYDGSYLNVDFDERYFTRKDRWRRASEYYEDGKVFRSVSTCLPYDVEFTNTYYENPKINFDLLVVLQDTNGEKVTKNSTYTLPSEGVPKASEVVTYTLKYQDGVTPDENKTYTKVYTPNGFKIDGVHYDFGETIIVTKNLYIEYDYDVEIIQDELPTPTRNNYTFKGWFDMSQGGHIVNDLTESNSNILYAQWADKDKVTIIRPDGIATELEKGSEYIIPDIPFKDESLVARVSFIYNDNSGKVDYSSITKTYQKNGVTVKETGTHYNVGDRIIVNENMTLIPDYTETVNPAKFPSDPERSDYTFLGWYDKLPNGTKYTEYSGDKDLTLYAKWHSNLPEAYTLPEVPSKDNEILSTVTFKYNNGNEDTTSNVLIQYTPNGYIDNATGNTYEAGDKVTIEDNTDIVPRYIETIIPCEFPSSLIENNYFLGWYDAETDGNKVTSYSGNEDIILYARYSDDYAIFMNGSDLNILLSDFTGQNDLYNYNASFRKATEEEYNNYLNGGYHYWFDEDVSDPSSPLPIRLWYDGDDFLYYSEASTIFLNSDSRDMFSFLDFYIIDLSDVDTSKVTNIAGMFRYDTNLETIYVSDSWDISSVTSSENMFYDNNSIIGQEGTTYDSNHVDKEYAHVDGGTSNPGYLTLKSNKNTYTITYPDGSTEEVEEGSTFTFPSVPSKEDEVISTVTFKYNNGNEDTTSDVLKEFVPNNWTVNNVNYDAGDTLTVTGNITLQANYVETVIGATFPSNPTKENYIFQGWYDSNAGGNKYTSYSDINDITLYAHWNSEGGVTPSDDILCKRYGDITHDETELETGDEFVCDVNGDGLFSEDDEIFYYVSDYYDTTLKEFNSNYAALIYSYSVLSGEIRTFDDGDGNASYNLYQNPAYNGPSSAIRELPTSSEWSNTSLYKTIRSILSVSGENTLNGNTLNSAFSYDGYSSRLLTAQELAGGCDIDVTDDNAYIPDKCSFLTININNQIEPGNTGHNYFLENPTGENEAAMINESYYHQHNDYYEAMTVRPVIDVPKTRMELVDANIYVITYPDGSTEEVEEGSTFTFPSVPSKEDEVISTVTFKYNNGDEDTTSDVLKEFIPNNWTVNNVNYDAGDTLTVTGNITLQANYVEIVVGATFPSDPTKENSTFLGWYDSETDGSEVSSYNGNENITLYAYWDSDECTDGESYTLGTNNTPKEDEIVSTVTFVYHNGSIDTTSNVIKIFTPNGWLVDGKHYNNGEEITKCNDTIIEPDYLERIKPANYPVNPTKDGYEFTGWYTLETGGVLTPVYNISQDITLHAQYTDNYALIDTGIKVKNKLYSKTGSKLINLRQATQEEFNNRTDTIVISTEDSPYFAYMWIVGNDLLYGSEAQVMFLNPNCWNMFAYSNDYPRYQTIDLSGFNTSKVENMGQMFYGNSYLEEINLSSFDTHNVTNMTYMFQLSTKIEDIDLSVFNTSKVTEMSQMFYGCSNLKNVNVSSFDTSNVTKFSGMFSNDNKLKTIDLTNFDTSNAISMEIMFAYSAMDKLDLSSFDTSKVTNMLGMFRDNTSLETVYVSDLWTTDLVTNSTNMFSNATKIVGQEGTTYDSDHVDKEYAHVDGGPSNPGYLTYKGVKNAYTITYPDGSTEEVEEGSTFTFPNVPSKENEVISTVTFKYNNGDEDTTSDVLKEFIPNNWTVNNVNYDAGDTLTVTGNITLQANYIETIIPAEFPSNPTKENSTFLGWYDAETNGNQVTSYSEEEDITLYAYWDDESSSSDILCKRAETLHTITCDSSNSYCNANNVSSISFGSLGTNGELHAGDAFDCDVNGDGIFDSDTERFYYVSNYFNTHTKEFDNSYAALVSSYNYDNGNPTKTGHFYNEDGWLIGGPRGSSNLPSTTKWSNTSLKEQTRKIEIGQNDYTDTDEFDYDNKAARMLTLEEVQSACGNNISDEGYLDNCIFLLENTAFAPDDQDILGYPQFNLDEYSMVYLETSSTEQYSYAYTLDSKTRSINENVLPSFLGGIRATIDVPMERIEIAKKNTITYPDGTVDKVNDGENYTFRTNTSTKEDEIVSTVTFIFDNGREDYTSNVTKSYITNGWKLNDTHINDGDTITVTEDIVLDYDYVETIIPCEFPIEPTKAYHTFNGWYNNDTKYTSYDLEEDITLTAKWTKKVNITYPDGTTERVESGTKITLDNGTDKDEVYHNITFKYNYENSPSDKVVRISSYDKFIGWLVNDTLYNSGDEIEVTEDITITPKYETIINNNNLPSDPEREGYDFLGWYDGKDLDTSNKVDITKINKDMTVYGQYKVTGEYIVFFDNKKYTFNDGESVNTFDLGYAYNEKNDNYEIVIDYQDNKTPIRIVPITITNTFVNWTDENNNEYSEIINLNTELDGMHFTSHYNQGEFNEIDLSTYYPDTADFAGFYTDRNNGNLVTSITTPQNINLYAHYDENKIAIITLDNEIEVYSIGDTYTLPSNNTKEDDIVVITFDPQNGEDVFTRNITTSYTFNGYKLDIDNTLYEGEHSFTVEGNMTFNSEFSSNTTGDSWPSNPSKDNYIFLGWYTNQTSGIEVFNFDNINTNTTLYARYTTNDESFVTLTNTVTGESLKVAKNTDWVFGDSKFNKDKKEKLGTITYKFNSNGYPDEEIDYYKTSTPTGYYIEGDDTLYNIDEAHQFTSDTNITPYYGNVVTDSHVGIDQFDYEITNGDKQIRCFSKTNQDAEDTHDDEEYTCYENYDENDGDVTVYLHWKELKKITVTEPNGDTNEYTEGDTYNTGVNSSNKNSDGYTVTFKYQDGTTDDTTQEHRTSYTANGWLINGNHVDDNTDITLEEDIVKEYDYSVDTSTITLPEPTRDGYTFKGWNSKSDGKGITYDNDAINSLNKDTTVYGIWTKDEIVVSFNSHGGSDIDDITYAYDEEYGDLPVPTYDDNHVFDGWYKEDTYENKVSSKTKATEDIELHAKWIEETFPFVYPVHTEPLVCDGSNYVNTGVMLYDGTNWEKDYEIGFTIDEYNSNDNVNQAVFANTKYEVESLNWPGLTFRKSGNSLEITQNINGTKKNVTFGDYAPGYKVRIMRIDKTVYYQINDGEVKSLQNMSNFNQQFELPVYFCAGDNGSGGTQRYLKGTISNYYVRRGTYEDLENHTVTYPDGTVETYIHGSVLDLEANESTKASEVVSTVTFKPENGENDIESTVVKNYTPNGFMINGVHYDDESSLVVDEDKVITYSYDEDIDEAIFPDDPEKEHYDFDGWFNGDTEYTEYSRDTDITLTAEYTRRTVTITLPDEPPVVIDEGDSYDLSENTEAKPEDNIAEVTFKYHDDETEDLVRYVTKSYTPNGWIIDGVHYDDYASITPTKDITVIPDYIETINGVEFPSEPVRENYEFLGWYTEETGGEKIESYSLEADIILHAQWEITLPTNIELDSEDITIVVGETHQIVVTFIPDGTEDNVTYTGFDNETISVVDGLVTGLEAGETTITVGLENVPDVTKTINVTVIDNKITSSVYTVTTKSLTGEDTRIIIGSEPSTTVKDYIDNIDNPNEYLVVYDKNGNIVSEENYETTNTTTGMRVKLVIDDHEYDEVTIIIRGDLNQDGVINVLDMTIMKNHILNKTMIEGYTIYAADLVEKEGATMEDAINVLDNTKLKNYILKKSDTLNE